MHSIEGGTVIRQVRVIDPFRRVDLVQDVYVVGGQVAEAGDPVEEVDGCGLWLVPRMTDMHVHFRDPGQSWKETIASGSQAAAHGGFSLVATMPNTDPVIDHPELVAWEQERARQVGLVRLLPIGAVTRGSQSESLADLYRMQEAGAVAFSDDGRAVASARMMRSALAYSTTLRGPIIDHAEDPSMVGGVVHEGEIAGRMGLSGMPEVQESIVAWRDVELAGLTGGRLHLAHLSAVSSLRALAYGKERGFRVTGEVTPHHLLLTDEALLDFGYLPVTKVNPPLRPEETRQALIQAVLGGLIDVIASDHAPHHRDEKEAPFDEAPFGISGIETALSAAMTVLLQSGQMTPTAFFELFTSGPDRVLGLGYPGLVAGASADLTLIDPKASWKVNASNFYSKGHNTPLEGHTLIGRAVATMMGGRWTMRDGEVLS